MIKKITTMMVLILSMSTIIFSQEPQEANIKHQIGVDASKFILLLDEQVSILDLTYRYTISEKQRFRIGGSLDISTEEGDLQNYEVRLGYDFNIKQTKNWNFYYGMDVTLGQTIASSSERKTTTIGPYIFFGALFKLGDHLSFSTEPSLTLLNKRRNDPNSFDANANANWMEFRFLNIGQIKVSFHL